MSSIKTYSYPRAALIGNPSDGYHGKTIAFVFSNFSVEATLNESSQLEIQVPKEERTFNSLQSFCDHIEYFGYYGGERLIKSTIKVFLDYCESKSIKLHKNLFTLSYQSDIPRSLGLAGSSAIVTAVIKALMEYYDVKIHNAQLANIILSAETQELGITAGLQDRVAQAFAHPMYMDFDEQHMRNHGIGRYKKIDPHLLPNLYIAYKVINSESSEIVHGDLRQSYASGDPVVVKGINRLSHITDQFYQNMTTKNTEVCHNLINENFYIRKKIMHISDSNKNLIETARASDVSAKFTGSGGAIIGMYDSKAALNKLKKNMALIGAEVIIPKVVNT